MLVVCKTEPGETAPATVHPDPARGGGIMEEDEKDFVVKKEEETKKVFKEEEVLEAIGNGSQAAFWDGADRYGEHEFKVPTTLYARIQTASTMDEEKLILEVEKYNVLYNPRDPFYKDNVRKDKAWSSIAAVMGADEDLCKDKWRKLRDAFVKKRKEKKKKGSRSGGGGVTPDYKYAQIMSFLLPHLQQRRYRSRSNLTRPPTVDVEERLDTPLSPSESGEVASTRDTSESPATSLSGPSTSRQTRSRSPREQMSSAAVEHAPRDRRRRPPPTTGLTEQLIALLQEPQTPKPLIPTEEAEEAYHFAISLVPMLLRMDRNHRQQAKIGILQMCHRLELASAQQPSHRGQQPTPPLDTPQPPPTQESTSRAVGPQDPTGPTGSHTHHREMLESSSEQLGEYSYEHL